MKLIFFLEDNHQQLKKDLNLTAALGLNGKMAVTFAMLVRQLWTSSAPSIAPSKLRELIGQKYANFRGFEQQDTQEFLSSLLSLLHEDLNRVVKKPFYESALDCSEDSHDQTCHIADESWSRHLSRDNSIIVDNFYGQFKSKVISEIGFDLLGRI